MNRGFNLNQQVQLYYRLVDCMYSCQEVNYLTLVKRTTIQEISMWNAVGKINIVRTVFLMLELVS